MAAAAPIHVYRAIVSEKKQFKMSITTKTTPIVRTADKATTNKKREGNSFINTLLLFILLAV